MITTEKVILALVAAAARTLAQECDCYLIGGSYPTYYANHGFWDFRSLSQYAVAEAPPVPGTRQENTDAPFTSDFFNWESEFAQFWGPQRWNNSGEEFMNVNSYNNLYIESDPEGQTETYLTMRTARVAADFQTSAEFESMEEVDHASMRMRARTHGSSGACTSIFTYRGAEQLKDVQESDIEVLTRDATDAVHYTNQPSYLEDGTIVDGASHQITLPVPWTEWSDHRLDWTPGRTTWSVDGQELHSQEFQAPTQPSRILLNAWSDGKDWTGTMDEGGAAYQHIQWIEIAYGVTDEAACQNVCSIDESSEPGAPRML